MYFSRVFLDTKKKSTMLSLRNLAEFHRNVESCFESYDGNHRPHHVWRLDNLGSDTVLLLMSEDKPHLDDFARDYGKSGKQPEVKSFDGMRSMLASDRVWHFRVRVNPVYTTTDENGKKKIYGHVTVKQQTDWFLKRAEGWGFSVVGDVFLTHRHIYRFQKDSNSEHVITLSTCVFDGCLRVTDTDLFWKTLTYGIGRGKAYGCGLFTIL